MSVRIPKAGRIITRRDGRVAVTLVMEVGLRERLGITAVVRNQEMSTILDAALRAYLPTLEELWKELK